MKPARYSVNGDTESKPSWVVPIEYFLPRRIVLSCLSKVDCMDSPDMPGVMYERTLRSMVSRFDNVFYRTTNEARLRCRQAHIETVLRHMRKHTLRRLGKDIKRQGLLDWKMTASVYDLFVAPLNIFERVFFTIDVGDTASSWISTFCSVFLVMMIFLSIIVWTVSTLPAVQHIPEDCIGVEVGECQPVPADFFKHVEAFCIYVFSTEYLVRLLTVHSVRFPLLQDSFLEPLLTGVPIEPVELDSKLRTVVKHVLAPANIIDLLAILPYWIQLAIGSDSGGGALMVLRVLRLTRLGRVFRLGKYHEAFQLFKRVIVQSLPALSLMVFFIALGCCLFGTLIWFVEGGEWYPEGNEKLLSLDPPITSRGAFLRQAHDIDDAVLEESPFRSIVHSFWYVIVTITTVGYGDEAPTSPLGKLLGAFAILMGIVVLAMPIGLVGANFSREYYLTMDEKRRRLLAREIAAANSRLEREQDQAVISDSSDEFDEANPRWAVGLELRRINTYRARILDDANSLDTCWSALLPSALSTPLCEELRAFVTKFLGGINDCDREPLATPIVSVSCFDELDSLQAHAQNAFACAYSASAGAAMGLRQAAESRRQVASFVERCWVYATTMCRVGKADDPPELYAMKAHVAMNPFIQTKRTTRARGAWSDCAAYPRWGATHAHGDTSFGAAWGPLPRARSTPEKACTLDSEAPPLGPAPLPGMLNEVALGSDDLIAFADLFLDHDPLREKPRGGLSVVTGRDGVDVEECHSQRLLEQRELRSSLTTSTVG